MKKAIFLIMFAAIAFVSMAQKGSWYVGGQVGYGLVTNKPAADSVDKSATTTWNISPEFGTFLTNTIQLGFVGGFSGDASKTGDNKTTSKLSVSPTIYLRNFYKFTDNLSAFAGIYVNYINGINKYFSYLPDGSEVETKDSHNGFGMSLGLGLAYALSPRFTVVGQYGVVGFKSVVKKDNDGNKDHTESNVDFGVNTVGSGTAFNVGVYYTFVKGK